MAVKRARASKGQGKGKSCDRQDKNTAGDVGEVAAKGTLGDAADVAVIGIAGLAPVSKGAPLTSATLQLTEAPRTSATLQQTKLYSRDMGGDAAEAATKGPDGLAARPKEAPRTRAMVQQTKEAPRESAALQQTKLRSAGGPVSSTVQQGESSALHSVEPHPACATQRATATSASQDASAMNASGKRKRRQRDKMSAALDTAAGKVGQGRQSNIDNMLGF